MARRFCNIISSSSSGVPCHGASYPCPRLALQSVLGRLTAGTNRYTLSSTCVQAMAFGSALPSIKCASMPHWNSASSVKPLQLAHRVFTTDVSMALQKPHAPLLLSQYQSATHMSMHSCPAAAADSHTMPVRPNLVLARGCVCLRLQKVSSP